ncbi:Lrp/AsnC family transcriptional regulator [Variovorax sp. ZS18.2.2]|uniref:Lrp/AsnC family transcriptional regulator n=1 Tax=Variovorax sp. ZS18.2.2 TaxID=2971255 RepID=UPI002151BF7F|nr:Lrp/AsnC family transcriptional regulator [Variovorax sp. ZS18.2.2]MCR6475887.1 Lrp/AsnC family transcriptional regulator [Variovorax sp. ZS18.2.2]
MKSKQTPLDKLDWKIMEALQANARVTNTELGKKVGLSQPAVTARIRRLEESGVIEGYAARINLALTGLHTSALMRLRTTHAQIKQCLHAFEAMPEVIEAHRITGDDCFLVRVVVARMSQLESVIDALSEFGAVSTAVVLESYPSKTVRAP